MMKKKMVNMIAVVLMLVMALSTMTDCTSQASADVVAGSTAAAVTPKYVFLFIGDGMSYPQIQSASYYLGAKSSNGGVVQQDLSFMKFPVAGSAQTYDSTSFCPDSASTATSIATGHKTYSGTINMDTTFTQSYETIAEKLKKQKDYKVGVISSVNLNHATPAAFYAHQASRSSYYEIGQELIASNFDYFAGGGLLQATGKNKDQQDLYQLAQNAGYKVMKTQADAEKLTAKDGKAIVIAETLADSDAISYQLDAAPGEWVLKDYVEKGIEVLNNDKGFFMMVEGGKIDWACHANDAGSAIADTVALSDAVQVAVDFYNQHPKETLILVTGDHETGGLTIGFAGTDYDTYFNSLQNQKISYAKFDSDYVTAYKANKTSFDDVLKDVKANFGLMLSSDSDSSKNSNLVLTQYELDKLKAAYSKTMREQSGELSQGEYILYGSYEPLTVTITHILNNKSGINFASYAHTGIPVPVFALGAGCDSFKDYYDNTDIYARLASLVKVS